MPLFSTVIPVHNREDLIAHTLESVLAQERPDLDIIVVDDGSTDDTLSEVKRFGDRVRLIRRQNQGPGAARNAGIREARGEYVAFLDSDDLWFPWTLDCYERIIHKHDHPVFIAGKPFLFSDAASVKAVQREPVRVEVFPDYLASADEWRWWGASSFVVRADALQKVEGFMEATDDTGQWILGEEADLAMKIGTEPGFIHVTEGPTFAYREHHGSAMDSIRTTAEGARYMVKQERAGNYPGGAERRRERWQIITRPVRSYSLACLDTERPDVGWWLYAHTGRWHLALGRWRYLFGFPVCAMLNYFQGSREEWS